MSDVSCTMDVKCGYGAIRNQAGMAVVETGKGFYSPSDCAGTLESDEDQHRRNIICAGLMGGQGAKAGGIGFGEQISPTIKASPSGGNIPDVVLSLAAAQAGELGCIGENISQTLSRNNGGFSYIAAVKNGEAEKKEQDIVCVHGSQDPICNTGHANAVNRNNGLENVICRATQQGNAECCKNCAPTLTGADGTSGNNQPVIFVQQNQVGEVRTGDVAGTINANAGMGGGNLPLVCYEHHPQDSRVKETDVNGTLGTFGNSVEGKDTIVQEAYAFDSLASNSMKSGNPVSGCRKIDCAKTIDTTSPDPTKNQGGMAIACYPINSMIIGKDAKDGDRQTTGIWNDKDPSPTIGTSQHHAVAIAENIIGRKVENGGNGVGAQEELAYTQNATGVMAVCTKGNGDAFESAVHTTVSASGGGRNGMSVRRLLPLETERLMGFPDNWTRIPWKGKPEEECPDAPRYKACGNSMCVNVMRWIGMRIQAVERRKEKNENL